MKVNTVTIIIGLILIGISIIVKNSNFPILIKIMIIVFCFGMWIMMILGDDIFLKNHNTIHTKSECEKKKLKDVNVGESENE